MVFEYQCGENFSTTLTTLLSFKTYHIKYLIIRTFAKETRSVVPKVGAGTRLVGVGINSPINKRGEAVEKVWEPLVLEEIFR